MVVCEFEYGIGDEVEIPGGKAGKVKGVWLDEDGVKHTFVGYVNGTGDPERQWLREDELSRPTKRRAARKK